MAKKTRTTTTKKASTSASKKKVTGTGDMLLVGSKTREALKSNGMNVASDALSGLNGWVYWLIEQASKRAQANGRKTVRAHDFIVM